jgi:hypothetical protein
MGTVLHFRTINQTTEPRGQTNLIWLPLTFASRIEKAGRASLGCGQLSEGREVTNRVTIKEPCYQRQCGAVGVDSSYFWGD